MGNEQSKAPPPYKWQYKQYVPKSGATKRASPPGRPDVVPPPTDEYLQQQQQPDVITVRWKPPESDGGTPITGYLVERRDMGTTVWVRAHAALTREPEIALAGLEPGRRYQFRVSAENALGLSQPSEPSAPVAVSIGSVATVPHFMRELKDAIAIEHEKVTFSVHILGTPTPHISWYKDAYEVFSSRRIRVSTENERSSLTFYQVALSDEGDIKCTATNRAGHVVTKARLRVEAPPRVKIPKTYEDGLLFELDDVIRLKATVTGRPVPSVTWLHNGEELQNDARCEIVTTERSTSLRVLDSRREDRGEYQIRATNDLGRAVTIAWDAPKDDGGCRIGSYTVEYYRIGWNVWLKAATCRLLTATLDDLIEGSEYKFRVKAENPYGMSEPGPDSDNVFIPDPKRGLLHPPSKSTANNVLLASDEWLEERRRRRAAMLDELEPKPAPPPPEKQTATCRLLTATLDDLIEGSEYKFRVKAENPYGMSEPGPDSDNVFIPDPKRGLLHPPSKSTANNVLLASDEWLEERRRRRAAMLDELEPKPAPPPPEKQIKAGESKLEPPPPVSEESEEMDEDDELLEDEEDEEEYSRLSGEEEETSMAGSELMLVLVPDADKVGGSKKHNNNSGDNNDKGALSRQQSLDAPPPMSLSAPELSALGTMRDAQQQRPLYLQRNAVSSTELLHERAMARLYQALAAEEAAEEKKRQAGFAAEDALEDLQTEIPGRTKITDTGQSFTDTGQQGVPQLEKMPLKPALKKPKRKIPEPKLDDNISDNKKIKNNDEDEIFRREMHDLNNQLILSRNRPLSPSSMTDESEPDIERTMSPYLRGPILHHYPEMDDDEPMETSSSRPTSAWSARSTSPFSKVVVMNEPPEGYDYGEPSPPPSPPPPKPKKIKVKRTKEKQLKDEIFLRGSVSPTENKIEVFKIPTLELTTPEEIKNIPVVSKEDDKNGEVKTKIKKPKLKVSKEKEKPKKEKSLEMQKEPEKPSHSMNIANTGVSLQKVVSEPLKLKLPKKGALKKTKKGEVPTPVIEERPVSPTEKRPVSPETKEKKKGGLKTKLKKVKEKFPLDRKNKTPEPILEPQETEVKGNLLTKEKKKKDSKYKEKKSKKDKTEKVTGEENSKSKESKEKKGFSILGVKLRRPTEMVREDEDLGVPRRRKSSQRQIPQVRLSSQSSFERAVEDSEARAVVIDRYGELINDLSRTKQFLNRRRVYLEHDELKAAASDDDQVDASSPSLPASSAPSSPAPPVETIKEEDEDWEEESSRMSEIPPSPPRSATPKHQQPSWTAPTSRDINIDTPRRSRSCSAGGEISGPYYI
ncbi:hypothetical protein B566_EDAN004265 [Ephemera danica]|nr:hypothetical protein B566_EDAN004265 [Ephemera danica]